MRVFLAVTIVIALLCCLISCSTEGRDQIVVQDYSGLNFDKVEMTIGKSLNIHKIICVSSEENKNKVMNQNEIPGMAIKEGSDINIYVGGGQDTNITGKDNVLLHTLTQQFDEHKVKYKIKRDTFINVKEGYAAGIEKTGEDYTIYINRSSWSGSPVIEYFNYIFYTDYKNIYRKDIYTNETKVIYSEKNSNTIKDMILFNDRIYCCLYGGNTYSIDFNGNDYKAVGDYTSIWLATNNMLYLAKSRDIYSISETDSKSESLYKIEIDDVCPNRIYNNKIYFSRNNIIYERTPDGQNTKQFLEGTIFTLEQDGSLLYGNNRKCYLYDLNTGVNHFVCRTEEDDYVLFIGRHNQTIYYSLPVGEPAKMKTYSLLLDQNDNMPKECSITDIYTGWMTDNGRYIYYISEDSSLYEYDTVTDTSIMKYEKLDQLMRYQQLVTVNDNVMYISSPNGLIKIDMDTGDTISIYKGNMNIIHISP